MSRIIKFRAWDGEKMEYGLVVWDWLCIEQEGMGNAGCDFMQFTGLTDKNGKEIYEGDVVRREWEGQNDTHHVETYEVYWANGFYLRPQPKAHPAQVSDDLEVIGNIYENPDLLKV